jgi:hypothetical protein
MRSLLRAVVVTLVCVLTVAGGTLAAQACIRGLAARDGTGVRSTTSTTGPATMPSGTLGWQAPGTDGERVASYWTRDRMRAARPLDVLSLPGRPVQQATPQDDAAQGAVAPTTGAEVEGDGGVVRTTGKVLFTLGGQDLQCSGSAVTSRNRDLVLTAGHCITDGAGAVATNWAFVPGFRDGRAPFGVFPAREITTTQEWGQRGDIAFDVGFAVLDTVGGRHLTDVVGAQGIVFDEPDGRDVVAFGYPAEEPFDGGRLVACAGTAVPDTVAGTTDAGIPCDMNGGSSGGPWFVDLDRVTGTGLVGSLNSFTFTGLPGVMFGPDFGERVQQLHAAAEVR